MKRGMRKHICRICGKVFYNKASNCVTCSKDCWKVNHRNQVNAYNAKKSKNKTSSLAEIARAAREAGMTYGQYVSQIETLNR